MFDCFIKNLIASFGFMLLTPLTEEDGNGNAEAVNESQDYQAETVREIHFSPFLSYHQRKPNALG